MRAIENVIRQAGFFLRRRDLLRMAYTDHAIRAALEGRRIFRVRHGWYSVADAPEAAIRAVRVGGRLTSLSALESYGFRVPASTHLHVAVPATASRLRSSGDRRTRLGQHDLVRVHWGDDKRGESGWRVSVEDALLAVIREQPRDVAVACAGALRRYGGWSESRIDAVFARAPSQVRRWRPLVSHLDDSHGETFLRLWFLDASIGFEQQVKVAGIGRFDFKVGPHTYVEVDGAQHDEGWADPATRSWQKGHYWDASMAMLGNTVLRFTYLQLSADLPRVLAAIQRTVFDDVTLTRYRMTRPAVGVAPAPVIRSTSSASLSPAPVSPAHAARKRRTFTTKHSRTARKDGRRGESPAFSGTDGGR